MKKNFLVLVILSLFVSCAHHHKDAKHHHHKCSKSCELHKGAMFEKHCAQSVAEGDVHVKGSEDFKLKHGGQVYYFSSKEKMATFKKHLENNLDSAHKNWNAGRK